MVNATSLNRPTRTAKTVVPLKNCTACGRLFACRKKWRGAWKEAETCSDRCNADLLRRNDQ